MNHTPDRLSSLSMQRTYHRTQNTEHRRNLVRLTMKQRATHWGRILQRHIRLTNSNVCLENYGLQRNSCFMRNAYLSTYKSKNRNEELFEQAKQALTAQEPHIAFKYLIRLSDTECLSARRLIGQLYLIGPSTPFSLTSFQQMEQHSHTREELGDGVKPEDLILASLTVGDDAGVENSSSLIDDFGKPAGGTGSAEEVLQEIKAQRKKNLRQLKQQQGLTSNRARRSHRKKSSRIKENEMINSNVPSGSSELLDELTVQEVLVKDEEKGILWLRRAIENHDHLSALLLAEHYLEKSETLEPSQRAEVAEKAISLLDSILESSHSDDQESLAIQQVASYLLGTIYYHRTGVPSDLSKALMYLFKSFQSFGKSPSSSLAALVVSESLLLAAHILLKEATTLEHEVTSLILAETNSESLTVLGIKYMTEAAVLNNLPKSKTYLFRYIVESLNNLAAESCHQEQIADDIGVLIGFLNETIDPADRITDEISLYQYAVKVLDEAVSLSLQEHMNPDPEALLLKADMVVETLNSQSTPTSELKTEALTLYLKAGELLSEQGYLCAGVLFYQEGRLIEAFRCYEKSAKLGSLEAYKNLASMYYQGDGVMKCEETAGVIMKFLQSVQVQYEETSAGK